MKNFMKVNSCTIFVFLALLGIHTHLSGFIPSQNSQLALNENQRAKYNGIDESTVQAHHVATNGEN